MNDLFVAWGWQDAKPLLSALLLPPGPWLLLAAIGGLAMRRRRRCGAPLLAVALVLGWLGSCQGVADHLEAWLLQPPPALGAEARALLQRQAADGRSAAIVVLGGGREALAPEYGQPNLGAYSMERLRYGAWLSRQSGLPLAFSGGTGHAARSGPSEASIAARIAREELGRPLRWAEGESRDTRENAARSVALLRQAGVTQLVVVTHGWHMRRSLRAFQQAAAPAAMDVLAAPLGLAPTDERPLLAWLPSGDGTRRVQIVVREWLGWVMNA